MYVFRNSIFTLKDFNTNDRIVLTGNQDNIHVPLSLSWQLLTAVQMKLLFVLPKGNVHVSTYMTVQCT